MTWRFQTKFQQVSDLMTVYQATVISRPQYASPAWWGFTTVSQRERLENFLRKSIKSGFYSTLSPSFASICDGADSRFFAGVVSNDLHTCTALSVSCLPWLTITMTCARVDIRSDSQTRKTDSSKETFLFDFFIVDDRVGFSVLSQPFSLTFI